MPARFCPLYVFSRLIVRPDPGDSCPANVKAGWATPPDGPNGLNLTVSTTRTPCCEPLSVQAVEAGSEILYPTHLFLLPPLEHTHDLQFFYYVPTAICHANHITIKDQFRYMH